MLFNSVAFLFVYLPIVVAGYFVIGRVNRTAAAGWLAIASFVFYGWWDWHYLPLLLASIGVNYLVGRQMAGAAGRARKAWLVSAIVADLVLLGYFKYANFFVSSAATVTGADWHIAAIALPIGISFFTFTQIAFLVDTYQGKVKEFRLIHYALFVTYFPHLVAGPVLHHKEMMPQFADPANYSPRAANFAVGLSIFTIGLAKKVLIADHVATLADPVFAPGANPGLIEAWVGALAYTFQLYFDFSGYSDMAIGLSRLFGVRLPLNFDSPYRASSIVDFWRRWHMTLSRFLRDYLYIPLGGNAHGGLMRYRNLMITMLLGGLWHGAGWTFVIWGGLHGFYLVVNHGWRHVREKLFPRTDGGEAWWAHVLAIALTFLAVVVGWVFFRAPDFQTAMGVLGGMVGANGIALPTALASRLGTIQPWFAALGIDVHASGIRWIDFGGLELKLLFVAMAVAWLCPNTQWIFREHAPALESSAQAPAVPIHRATTWTPSPRWALVLAILLVVCIVNLNRPSQFLYYQF